MTIAEDKFLTLVPNQLRDVANENAEIAKELHILNDRMQKLIEILGEK